MKTLDPDQSLLIERWIRTHQNYAIKVNMQVFRKSGTWIATFVAQPRPEGCRTPVETTMAASQFPTAAPRRALANLATST